MSYATLLLTGTSLKEIAANIKYYISQKTLLKLLHTFVMKHDDRLFILVLQPSE